MDARQGRFFRFAVRVSFSIAATVAIAAPVGAAGYRTTNFEVAAPTPQLAKEIGDAAEVYRRDLAIEWLGEELPTWHDRCPIKARVAPGLGAGGATSFLFDRGEVYGWRMNIQGSRIRILDSVLPHEVTHTIFATHFRRPLPRWADEGACTTVEHASEIAKQESMLIEQLRGRRSLPFSQMMMMKEYPSDVMPLYSQGHSVVHFLIQRRGKAAFLEFLGDGMKDENWPRAVREHYGYRNLLTMQNTWLDWIKQGRPPIAPDQDGEIVLASATSVPRSTTVDNAAAPSTNLVQVAVLPERPAPNLIYRAKRSNEPALQVSSEPQSRNERAGERHDDAVVLEWSREPRKRAVSENETVIK